MERCRSKGDRTLRGRTPERLGDARADALLWSGDLIGDRILGEQAPGFLFGIGDLMGEQTADEVRDIVGDSMGDVIRIGERQTGFLRGERMRSLPSRIALLTAS